MAEMSSLEFKASLCTCGFLTCLQKLEAPDPSGKRRLRPLERRKDLPFTQFSLYLRTGTVQIEVLFLSARSYLQ